jgi:hypothetical protein
MDEFSITIRLGELRAALKLAKASTSLRGIRANAAPQRTFG